MKWTQAHTLRLVLSALALAAAAWVVDRTEWVEVTEPVPLPDAMREDGTFVAQHLLKQLGMRVRAAQDLQALPPPDATLLLSTPFWNLLSGADDRLRQWVQGGGHLVVDLAMLERPSTGAWFVPRLLPSPRDGPMRNAADWCRVLSPAPSGTPSANWADSAGFVLCNWGDQRLQPVPGAHWTLVNEQGDVVVQRLAVGKGQITAFAGGFRFDWQNSGPWQAASHAEARRLLNFSNRGLLEGDNAALLAALVDARAGAEVWFVTRMQRPPLPLWLWQQVAPALLLAAGALALALWRGGVRFGPLQADPPAARRSVAAQVQGLADFLDRRQPEALHGFACRALLEAAAPHINGWARMAPADRTAALARHTGLPADTLAQALQPRVKRTASAWADTLALLETARRSLAQGRPQHSPSDKGDSA